MVVRIVLYVLYIQDHCPTLYALQANAYEQSIQQWRSPGAGARLMSCLKFQLSCRQLVLDSTPCNVLLPTRTRHACYHLSKYRPQQTTV
jgi:hypothetical protein